MEKCNICGAPKSIFDSECSACLYRKQKKAREIPIDTIILTTTPSLEGYKIIKILGIVTSEGVLGVSLFQDLAAGFTDVLGGRSLSMQNSLKNLREVCLTELKKEAAEKEAQAVVGITLHYSEISGGGKSMLFLVVSGTAVKISPLPKKEIT